MAGRTSMRKPTPNGDVKRTKQKSRYHLPKDLFGDESPYEYGFRDNLPRQLGAHSGNHVFIRLHINQQDPQVAQGGQYGGQYVVNHMVLMQHNVSTPLLVQHKDIWIYITDGSQQFVLSKKQYKCEITHKIVGYETANYLCIEAIYVIEKQNFFSY